MYTIFGGTLGSSINLVINGEVPVSAEKCFANARNTSSLGLKTYRDWKQPYGPYARLAVVGGGPSLKNHAEDLRDFYGDVWAINGAWKWCQDNGINATFFACDPHPIVKDWAQGVSRAILELSCDSGVFELLKSADVYTFDADIEKGGIAGYASTASNAPHLAARMGYRHVTLFGCDSSYLPNASHAYTDEDRKEQLIIRCNGEEHLTAPDLFMQALGLAKFCRELPDFLSENSGGLLTAMIKDPKYHIVWVSQAMADGLVMDEKPKVSGAVAMADNLEAFGLTEKDVAA